MATVSNRVQDEINKRLTLNMLIQGAAVHSHMTLHHLVRDELNAVNPKLLPLYDQVSVGGFLANWYGDLVLVAGRPRRFWKQIGQPDHPFFAHPLLRQHGGELAESARRVAVARAREKRVWKSPFLLTGYLTCQVARALWHERSATTQLEWLATEATSMMWGIDQDRLRAELTMEPSIRDVRRQPTRAGRFYQRCAIGWSCVDRFENLPGEPLGVIARAWVWPLLAHELVKGVAELVCLHGLNSLEDDTYEAVMHATERVDFEPWHMQAGSELWRRFLAARSTSQPLAETLMHIARLQPSELEDLMMAIVEDENSARLRIANLH